MHCVITNTLPPEPLEPFGPLNFDDAEVLDLLPETYHIIRDLKRERVAPFYTYGTTLFEEEFDLGVDVICLILRCMADRPAHRPSLEELEGWVKLFEAVEGINEIDDYYEQVYGRPPDVSSALAAPFFASCFAVKQ